MSSAAPRMLHESGHATHPALHLRDARDAHIVFEAVRRNVLPLITRRLTANERDMLGSGNIFVWEEAEHKQGGLERWTDGRRWSQSRMRGDYLFYEEKIEVTTEEREAKAARRARRTLDPFATPTAPARRQDRPSKPNGLTKQTYSTHVNVDDGPPRKWHIVAYFSGDDYMSLPVIESYEYLRVIHVPQGVFMPAKGGLTRVSRLLTDTSGNEYARAAASPDWVSSSWSVPPSPKWDDVSARPESPCSSSSSTSAFMYPANHLSTSQTQHISPDHPSLPRLSTVAPIRPLAPSSLRRHTAPSGTIPTPYSPLTSEDRRVLNSFRVAL